MKYLFVILPLFVSACSLNPTKEVVTEYKYVTKKVPTELLEIPENIPAFDVNKSQKDLSVWLIENEKRVTTLENQLKKIKEYQDKN